VISDFYHCQQFWILYHFEDAFELFLLSRFGLEDNKDVKKIYSSFNLLDNCKRVMMTELLDVCNN
jgi:hypothetical protein